MELSNRPSNPVSFNDNDMPIEENYDISYLSRVAITQSVMEEGHPWHVFIVENVNSIRSKHGISNVHDRETNYHYIASTRPMAGRPSRMIILDIISRWA